MRPDESFVGQNIRALQTMLRVIAASEDKTLSLIPDGFYGAQTQAAVREFQQSRGIPVTGVANENTWNRIAAEYPDAWINVGPATPLQLIINPGKNYQKGDQSYLIYLFQAMLVALAEIYGAIAAPAITGFYDDVTAEAISTFQGMNALPQTGILDKITWHHLALQYPLAVNHQETENRKSR